MSTNIRIATFNCENLFARFKFKAGIDPAKVSKDGFTVNELAFDFINEDEKRLTAAVIKAVNADVIALQEVDNFEVLKRFRGRHLGKAGYVHSILIDGNDPRHIDVAVLSRFPLVKIRTYQHRRRPGAFLFSRDCLEIDVEVGSATLTLFVNHFKSMLDKKHPAEGRKFTRNARMLQAAAVKELVKDRFGKTPGGQPFVVLGDLNDYLGPGDGTTDGISDLAQWNHVENVINRLPQTERWTHFYETTKAKNKLPDAYRQLDYLLVSKSLAQSSVALPFVERRGLCHNAVLHTGPRFAEVGNSRPAASDHCALAMDLTLP